MKLRSLTNIILTFASFAVAGFAQATVTGRDWSVIYLRQANIGTVKAYFSVGPDGKHFKGNTGCNIMNGSVFIDRDRIKFDAIITTKRACTRQTAPIESALLATLNRATSYKFGPDRLRLFSGKTLLAEFGPGSVDTNEDGTFNTADRTRLEDKKWILELVNGIAISHVEPRAFIVFDPEKGSAGGDTSCNAYGGDYKTNGSRIAITQIISTMRACIEDKRMNVERDLLENLKSADRYSIKDNKLMLYKRDKLLLTFAGEQK